MSIEEQVENAISKSIATQNVVKVRAIAGTNWYPDSRYDWDFEDITPKGHEAAEVIYKVWGTRDGKQFTLEVIEESDELEDLPCGCDTGSQSLPSTSDPSEVCASCGQLLS